MSSSETVLQLVDELAVGGSVVDLVVYVFLLPSHGKCDFFGSAATVRRLVCLKM